LQREEPAYRLVEVDEVWLEILGGRDTVFQEEENEWGW